MAAGAAAAPGRAAVIPERTLRVSTDPGPSRDPVISTDGRHVAFVTADGPSSHVVVLDRTTGVRRRVTEGADGSSGAPAISGDGAIVAFESAATNLTPSAADANGAADVFVRDRRGPVERVTAGSGPSTAPDLSADGNLVIFSSEAADLVPGDTNGRADVFVFDRRSRTTRLISRGPDGRPLPGRSGTPAISGDGRFVVFESEVADVAQVFVAELSTGRVERVSVSSREVPQDRAVAAPFRMSPDISRDGRYVVWESDAANLVREDINRRTDVFLRDRLRGRTTLVSAASSGIQGDNDSFSPRISPSGKAIAFQSFASNLVPPSEDGPREDVFVRDLRHGTTTIASITSSGARRAAELTGPILQRPAIGNDATLAAFTSSAPNLVAGDGNGTSDVFVRLMAPARTRLRGLRRGPRPVVLVSWDEPRVRRFECRLDGGPSFRCSSRIELARRFGRVLTVRAAGAGLATEHPGLRVVVRRDRQAPSVSVRTPRGRTLRSVRGRAGDRGDAGLGRVEVAVTVRLGGGRCRILDAGRMVSAPCGKARFSPARGLRRWELRLPEALRGAILVRARAVDRAGNRSPVRRARAFVG